MNEKEEEGTRENKQVELLLQAVEFIKTSRLVAARKSYLEALSLQSEGRHNDNSSGGINTKNKTIKAKSAKIAPLATKKRISF